MRKIPCSRICCSISLFLAWTLFTCGVDVCHAKRRTTFDKDITINTEQKAELDKFKALVVDRVPHDYMKENIYLLKFLRYKNFDIPEAEKFLMQVLQWRKENKMDTIGEEDWSDMKQKFSYNLQMRDRDGEPVLYIDVESMDVRQAVIQGGDYRFLRYVDSGLEEACSLVRTLGEKYQNVTRGHLIINGKGYNLVQHGCWRCIPSLLRIVLSYEQHWPECVDRILVLNAPGIIVPLVDTVKPLLSPTTRGALQVLGQNKKTILEALLKFMELDEIPVEFGGRKILDNFQGGDDYDENFTY